MIRAERGWGFQPQPLGQDAPSYVREPLGGLRPT